MVEISQVCRFAKWELEKFEKALIKIGMIKINGLYRWHLKFYKWSHKAFSPSAPDRPLTALGRGIRVS